MPGYGVASVTLTGSAATGLSVGPEHLARCASLPLTVKLGRRPLAVRPTTLRLEQYIRGLRLTPVPEKVDWYTKAALSLARMYRNDVEGCCVISGKAHSLGIWSANDPDSFDGKTVVATDGEIYGEYHRICGAGDNGCYIPTVLDEGVNRGWLAAGKRYKISGYVSCDWRSKELTQVGLELFGCGTIGFNLPGAWTQSNVWEPTNSRIAGGHDVTPCGYGSAVIGTSADGVVVSSWGRLYLFTWAAWLSSRWIGELYFMVPEFLWTGADGRSPSNVSLAALKADMAVIKGGGIPPLPDPTPPEPPEPPVPPLPPVPPVPPVPLPPEPPVPVHPTLSVKLTGVFPRGALGHEQVTLTGVAVPADVSFPDSHEIALSDYGDVTEAAMPKLVGIVTTILSALGLGSFFHFGGDRLKLLRPGKLTPAQWAVLIQAIMQLLSVILPLIAGG